MVDIDRRLREQEDKDAEVARKCQEDAEKEAKEQHAKDGELVRKCQEEMEQNARDQVATDNHVAPTDEQIKKVCARGVGDDAGRTRTGERRSSVVQKSLDDFFYCRSGMSLEGVSTGRRSVRQKRRKTKKSSRAGHKQRKRVKFSNIVQTICLTESSGSDDNIFYDGNEASGEDNGDRTSHRIANGGRDAVAGARESRSANDGFNAAANEVDPKIAAQRDADGIHASEEEVPVSTGTLYRHDNNDGYTFEGRTAIPNHGNLKSGGAQHRCKGALRIWCKVKRKLRQRLVHSNFNVANIVDILEFVVSVLKGSLGCMLK
ncbi:uncharacterized protein LOC125523269 isoform X2 [Triticum urartu]|uniref:uncharacterized protein LOC125523269 isoform X2 n=1 Tax=Triticum urartu TaxID=4572 RepID=UPI002044AAB5|nr:uncharacterized protein LOC125523269 isoform X2 [Triticum urartu]